MQRRSGLASVTVMLLVAVGLAAPIAARAPAPPFKAYVDMKTFMQHVLSPAAQVIWRSNATIIDANGEHDLSPRTDADWENLVTGTATLVEATNGLLIPQRLRDPAWVGHVRNLARAAEKAYQGAEHHDLKAVSEVSDQLDGLCAACHRQYGLE